MINITLYAIRIVKDLRDPQHLLPGTWLRMGYFDLDYRAVGLPGYSWRASACPLEDALVKLDVMTDNINYIIQHFLNQIEVEVVSFKLTEIK